MIEDTKKWVLSPERKAPKVTREYTAKHLDTMLNKFLKTMQTTATRLQEKLLIVPIIVSGSGLVNARALPQALRTARKPQMMEKAEIFVIFV